jgi:hypothetical protein
MSVTEAQINARAQLFGAATTKTFISILICLMVLAAGILIPLSMKNNEKGLTPAWKGLQEDEKAFLDRVQESAFWYFWNETDPDTGLVQDRATNTEVSSIAAVGFGLSAICVAETRGWITYDQAYERVLKTLKSFDPDSPLVEGERGFFYHWVDAKTGERAWESEISLIDTAILTAGALHAGQHFKGTEIEPLAGRIYGAVEWDWMMSGDLLTVVPGGEPWDGYDEYILAYLLALGSPTHPIPERSWDAMASAYEWYSYGGVEFLTPDGGNTMLAYLYQFPLCWIDLRYVHDRYADYWQNAVAALKANRKFCLDEAAEKGWPELWGWTACDGKEGYLGYRGVFDDTVAPSAVAASIALIPEQAIPMLEHMYEEYGDRIWREYGFTNAFNPAQNWYDEDYIGIDQGNIVLMLEAFRSESVWDEFMRVPYVTTGLNKAGFVQD